jgi:ubiquinone/menaquinone biosynthesis C-methylase UbiE
MRRVTVHAWVGLMRSTEPDLVSTKYAKLASHYDSKWPFYVAATIHNTIARLSPAPGHRVLDVGCGTGQLLCTLSGGPLSLRLFGVDPSAEMLAIARSRVSANVSLARAPAELLPFPDGTFDRVVSTSVFHYIRRPRAALDEFRRVLAPGGQLLVTDWCDDYLACKLCDAVLRLFNRAHFRTYTCKECEALLREASFARVEIERYRIGWFWGLMTARAAGRSA